MTRGYETTNGRYVEVGDSGRDRKRAKHCPACDGVLGDVLACPCGWTADRPAGVAR